MMKKYLVLLLAMLIFCTSVFALPLEDSLVFTATIPLDYGVNVPDDAVMFDRFAIGLETDSDTHVIVRENTFHVGEIIETLPDSLSFIMMYYGNLPFPYDVSIRIDPGTGWYMYQDDELISFPVSVSYDAPQNPDPSITIGEEREGSVPVHIEPAGAKNGMPVLEVTLGWEGLRDGIPGEYRADIGVRVDVI